MGSEQGDPAHGGFGSGQVLRALPGGAGRRVRGACDGCGRKRLCRSSDGRRLLPVGPFPSLRGGGGAGPDRPDGHRPGARCAGTGVCRADPGTDAISGTSPVREHGFRGGAHRPARRPGGHRPDALCQIRGQLSRFRRLLSRLLGLERGGGTSPPSPAGCRLGRDSRSHPGGDPVAPLQRCRECVGSHLRELIRPCRGGDGTGCLFQRRGGARRSAFRPGGPGRHRPTWDRADLRRGGDGPPAGDRRRPRIPGSDAGSVLYREGHRRRPAPVGGGWPSRHHGGGSGPLGPRPRHPHLPLRDLHRKPGLPGGRNGRPGRPGTGTGARTHRLAGWKTARHPPGGPRLPRGGPHDRGRFHLPTALHRCPSPKPTGDPGRGPRPVGRGVARHVRPRDTVAARPPRGAGLRPHRVGRRPDRLGLETVLEMAS